MQAPDTVSVHTFFSLKRLLNNWSLVKAKMREKSFVQTVRRFEFKLISGIEKPFHKY